MTHPTVPDRRSSPIALALTLLVGAVALMWAAELVDQLLLDERLDRHGIRPRELGGLDGVLWAPFLHSGLGHLVANTVPFLVLGGLIALKGGDRFVQVSLGVMLLGGGAVWLLGRSVVHIGASGVVFGFLGYLVGAAIFERRLRSIVLGVTAVVLYGGLVWGLVPTPGVSWESHLFGGAAGVAVASRVARPEAA
ncbi:MAG TPA: rhomboid family intramembrane serine protease [Acidimicrobiales bacterium]|nr:rhomboid family intramembrane serine protease [Acidimicrobiales bacterium]